MTTYYTYQSFEEFTGGRSYIGVRKCPADATPETDPYLGSYTDVTFSPTAKGILGVYDCKEEALQAEIELHIQYDVAKNPRFANKARATSTGFSCDGNSEETRKKLSEAMSGENHPMYGKHLSEETRAKISESISGENHPKYTPRDWYHPLHGTFLQKSISELMKMFPAQNLNQGHLSEVSKEKRSHHKGWRLLKNKNEKVHHEWSIPRDWYHPVHGEVLQKSAPELVRLFPEQNLCKSNLSPVALGNRPHHKGWRLLENKDRNVHHKWSIPRDWFHPLHGTFLQKSAPELARLFPEQNLCRNVLRKVALGKQSHHKGWSILVDSGA